MCCWFIVMHHQRAKGDLSHGGRNTTCLLDPIQCIRPRVQRETEESCVLLPHFDPRHNDDCFSSLNMQPYFTYCGEPWTFQPSVLCCDNFVLMSWSGLSTKTTWLGSGKDCVLVATNLAGNGPRGLLKNTRLCHTYKCWNSVVPSFWFYTLDVETQSQTEVAGFSSVTPPSSLSTSPCESQVMNV